MRQRSIPRLRNAKLASPLVKQYSAAARITDPLMTSFAFLSQSTFLRAPAPSTATPFAVAGIAWDGAVTNRPGARFGPRAIREASHMLCDATHPHFDVAPLGQLGDAGDLALPNTSLEGMRAAMQPLVAKLIRAHHMCWLGGDHSITLALLRAYRAWSGKPLAVIHFDAHCDTWGDHFGEPSGPTAPGSTRRCAKASSSTNASRNSASALPARAKRAST